MSTNDIVEIAKQLVSIPSTVDNPAALQEALELAAGMIREVPGITLERFENNGTPSLLAYAGQKRPSCFTVTLHGHLDVVPGNPEQFAPYVSNGKLFGRGSHDMKTAAVVLADIFCRLAPEVSYPLALQLVTDEETGGHDGVQHQIANGFRTRFAITGEHNFYNNIIYNTARGICWIEVGFTGKSAHGAYVWLGDNALEKATRFARAIAAKYPHPNHETWRTTASIASIATTNTTYNRIPDIASLRVDFRFIKEDPVFTNKESVIAFIHSLDPDAQIIDFPIMEPAVHVAEDNPFVQILSRSVSDTVGRPVVFRSRPAASDARHYVPFGMDVVEYGVTGLGPHSDNEHINIDSIPLYVAALERFLTDPALADLAEKANHKHKPARDITSKAIRRHTYGQRQILAK